MKKISTLLVNDGAHRFGEAIIKNIEELGFGILSKPDFEVFLFHNLMINIEINNRNADLMEVLKITPTKLRSLEMARSAKYFNLDLSDKRNWILIFDALEGKKLETEDKENGKVRIYIDNLHVHRLIERFVVERGSSIDYKLNKNQLVIKYSAFLALLDAVLMHATFKPLLSAINEDKSALGVEKEFNKLESIFKDLKDSFKDKAYDKIAEDALSMIIKIVRKKLDI